METKMRIPLNKWREDMMKIAGDWNGEDRKFTSGGKLYTYEEAKLATEAVDIIDELEATLNFLDY